MNDSERNAFLAHFQVDGRGVGFAVLGGTFAEGIDLVGARLIGAFIATLGLPQFNQVNEELRRRLARKFGSGYDYMYLFPGIRKVVQAAGRVIRTTSDSGTVHLIDDRFTRLDLLRLLPHWWAIDTNVATRPSLPRATTGQTDYRSTTKRCSTTVADVRRLKYRYRFRPQAAIAHRLSNDSFDASVGINADGPNVISISLLQGEPVGRC